MSNTKLITEIEPGQRYSDYHPSDMDREVFTFVSTEPTRQDGFLWLNYIDQDGARHRENVPVWMAVYPAGPVPSAVRAAAEQLNAELNHPAFKAAVVKIMDAEMIEKIAEQVHNAWMATKRTQGISSRPSEWGEEQMVPYAQLSERAKDLDRGTVRAVLDGVAAAGYGLLS